MTGRTIWVATDTQRHRRALMVELKQEHGPVAIACDTVLVSKAKLQNDGGAIRDGFASIAEEAGCSRDQVRAFVEHAGQIGWLDDLELDDDGRRFRARISGWRTDQDKAYATWRKRDQRDRDRQPIFERDGWACVGCGSTKDLTIDHIVARSKGGGDDEANLQTLCGTCNRKKGTNDQSVTASHGVSPSVPECPPTGQDSTEEQNPPNPPQAGGTSGPIDSARDRLRLSAPARPPGSRGREQAHYREQMTAWANQHFPGCDPKGVEQLVTWVRSRDADPTPAAVREFADAAPNFAHLLEPTEAAA